MLRTSYPTSISFALSDLEKNAGFIRRNFFFSYPAVLKVLFVRRQFKHCPRELSLRSFGIEIIYSCNGGVHAGPLQRLYGWSVGIVNVGKVGQARVHNFHDHLLNAGWNIIPKLYVMKCRIGCTFNFEFGERRVYLAYGVSILFTRWMYVKL